MLTQELKNIILSLANLALFIIILAKFWVSPDMVGVPMRLWMVGCPFIVLPILIPSLEKRVGKHLRGALFLLLALALAHVVAAFLRKDPSLWQLESLWGVVGLTCIFVYYAPERKSEQA